MITINALLLVFLINALYCSNHDIPVKTDTALNDNHDISYVPEWSKEAVWYQIFVERFRNGDPSNDPGREDIRGTYPDSIPGNWNITPWGSDWYKPDAYFSQSNLTNQWDNLQLRRYGGDLQGVMDQLEYLESLGINAIYFNPLNDSPSLHKYDARNWRHIDRNFGPDPAKDIEIMASEDPVKPETWKWTTADSLFLRLIKKCHQKGIRIIMDYSFNHTGIDFWAFNDVRARGRQSPYADWYEIERFDDPSTPEDEFSYRGWSGVQIMPELKKDIIGDKTDMPFEGDFHSQQARNHIFNVARRWLDPDNDGNPEDGIDGYRLDVAAEVPMGFWRAFRKVIRSVQPEAYLVGEIWWKSWPDQLLFPNNFLKGDQFDAIMNYRWFRPTRHFFTGVPDEMKVSDFVAEMLDKFSGIDINRLQAMMNVVATHDSPRISTSLYNKNDYKYKAKPYDDVNYKIDKPDEKTLNIQKMLLVFQFSFTGAPHIWYGDEVGMWGADDPDSRKPMIWPDIHYEDETHHPFGLERKTDKVLQDTSLLNFYKKLIRIRRSHPALIHGDITFSVIDDRDKVLAYNRKFENTEIVAVFNKSCDTRLVEIPVSHNGSYRNAINPGITAIAKKHLLKINLDGMRADIWINQDLHGQ